MPPPSILPLLLLLLGCVMIELAASLSSDTFVTMMGTSAVLLSADPSLALKVNLSVPLKPSLGVYVKAPV